jgi:hypothetical protein
MVGWKYDMIKTFGEIWDQILHQKNTALIKMKMTARTFGYRDSMGPDVDISEE